MPCGFKDKCPAKNSWCEELDHPHPKCMVHVLEAYEKLSHRHSKLLHDIELLYYRLARMRDNDSQ